MTGVHLDWSMATVGDLQPCVLCKKPALLRSPDKQVPCHKVCAEKWTEQRQKERVAERAREAEEPVIERTRER